MVCPTNRSRSPSIKECRPIGHLVSHESLIASKVQKLDDGVRFLFCASRLTYVRISCCLPAVPFSYFDDSVRNLIKFSLNSPLLQCRATCER